MKMPNLWQMLPGQKRGMGTTAKMLFVALPIAAYMAGKLMGTRMENGENKW